jgi:hypothetical protein
VEVQIDATRLIHVSYTEAERTMDAAGYMMCAPGQSMAVQIDLAVYKQKLTDILQLDSGLAC